VEYSDIEWQETRYDGVSIHFFESDRVTGYAAVLIRMAPGASYPRHRHNGREEVLVLEGRFEDEAGAYAAGSFVSFAAGSTHHPRCPADATEPCIFFATVRDGIELFGR